VNSSKIIDPPKTRLRVAIFGWTLQPLNIALAKCYRLDRTGQGAVGGRRSWAGVWRRILVHCLQTMAYKMAPSMMPNDTVMWWELQSRVTVAASRIRVTSSCGYLEKQRNRILKRFEGHLLLANMRQALFIALAFAVAGTFNSPYCLNIQFTSKMLTKRTVLQNCVTHILQYYMMV